MRKSSGQAAWQNSAPGDIVTICWQGEDFFSPRPSYIKIISFGVIVLITIAYQFRNSVMNGSPFFSVLNFGVVGIFGDQLSSLIDFQFFHLAIFALTVNASSWQIGAVAEVPHSDGVAPFRSFFGGASRVRRRACLQAGLLV